MLARGRYVRARMLLEDPLGLQQIVAPTVAVGVWTAHADEDHPQVAYSASAFTLGEITDVAGAQTGVVIGIEAIAGSTYYIKVNIGGALYRAALEAVP